MDHEFRLRQYQEDLVGFIEDSLEKSEGVAIESPTGSGKTVTALSACLGYAGRHGKRILYLTRTNSQQEQVVRELRRLSEKSNIRFVPMQGRSNLCLLYKEVEGHQEFSADSLSRFCRLRKKKAMQGKPDACRYYNYDVWSENTKNYIFSEHPFAEEFAEYGMDKVVCPYEALKKALPEADVVLAPYASFLNPGIGERFLQHWGVSRDDLIIILDEAHNLPDLAREMSSFTVSVKQTNFAEIEAQEYGDILLFQKYKSSDVLEMVRSAILSLVNERIGESEEVRIGFHDIIETIMIQNRISSETFHDLVQYMELFGESIAERRERDGKVPRSSVMNVALSALKWEGIDEEKFIAIISRSGEGSISTFCLDPSLLMAPLKGSKTVHMSGTLFPADIYLGMIGFTDLPSKRVTDIFSSDRRKIFYYPDLTTKFDEFDDEEARRMHDMIEKIVLANSRGTIVYFPSYTAMQRILLFRFPFKVLAEERRMDQKEVFSMISNFRKTRNTLFAVSGGRISEGMNFPGKELEIVVIAGIPYPRPDAKNRAMQEYYERLKGKGWEYAVRFPTAIKIKQEIGRLIRDESDIGVAIILDKRASYFKKEMPEMRISTDPANDSRAFFDKFSNQQVQTNR